MATRRNPGRRDIHDFQGGDKVRLSAKFLRSTGQYTGSASRRIWTIKEIQDEFAIVDEPADTRWYSAAEIAADPSLKWRRINVANLVRIGTFSSRDA